MDSERKGRLVVLGCQASALVVAVAMIAGQYHAMTTVTHPQPLPTTGSDSVEPRLGLFERIRLRRTVQERYDQLSQMDELTPAQQQQLATISELLHG